MLFSSHQLDLVEHLCESVAIIDHGRLVACGDVDSLRQNGPHLISIVIHGAPSGWIDRLTGVTLVEHNGHESVLELDEATDPQGVLDVARQAGTVTHFSEQQPTLAELFREVVSA